MILPSLNYEQKAWMNGHRCVIGVDEVGRGAWAGPIVAAAAQLPTNSICFERWEDDDSSTQLPRLLRDSKKLSETQRLQVDGEIRDLATQIAVGIVEVEEINQMGIGPANFLAMSRALAELNEDPDFILIDGFNHPDIDSRKQQSIIKGDGIVASIAAASIVAKVYRDGIMKKIATEYPEYGFEQHKGYGTANHQKAIATHGMSAIHRLNFNLKFLAKTE